MSAFQANQYGNTREIRRAIIPSRGIRRCGAGMRAPAKTAFEDRLVTTPVTDASEGPDATAGHTTGWDCAEPDPRRLKRSAGRLHARGAGGRPGAAQQGAGRTLRGRRGRASLQRPRRGRDPKPAERQRRPGTISRDGPGSETQRRSARLDDGPKSQASGRGDEWTTDRAAGPSGPSGPWSRDLGSAEDAPTARGAQRIRASSNPAPLSFSGVARLIEIMVRGWSGWSRCVRPPPPVGTMVPTVPMVPSPELLRYPGHRGSPVVARVRSNTSANSRAVVIV